MNDAEDGHQQVARVLSPDTDQVVTVPDASHFEDPLRDYRFQRLAEHFNSLFDSISRAGHKGDITRYNHTHDMVNDRCMLFCLEAERKNNLNTRADDMWILPLLCFDLLMSWEDRCMLFSLSAPLFGFSTDAVYEGVKSLRLTMDLERSGRAVSRCNGIDVQNLALSMFWPKLAQFCSRCFLKTSVLMDEGHYTYCTLCAAKCHSGMDSRLMDIPMRCAVVDESGKSWWDYRGEHNTSFQFMEADQYIAQQQCPEHLMPVLDPPTPCSPTEMVAISGSEAERLSQWSASLQPSFEWESISSDHVYPIELPCDFTLRKVRLRRAAWTVRCGAQCSKMYVSISANYIIMEVDAKYCGSMLPESDRTVVCLSYKRYPIGRFVTDHVLNIARDYPEYHAGYSNDTDHVPVPLLCCSMCMNRCAHLRQHIDRSQRTVYYCDWCLLWRASRGAYTMQSTDTPTLGILWKPKYCPWLPESV